MPTVTFLNTKCAVAVTRYRNGQTALILRHRKEDFAVASVAMQRMHPNGCVWVKDYSENEGMVKALVGAGVIAPEIMDSQQSGFVTVHAYRLLEA
jgi:hypothetical protein